MVEDVLERITESEEGVYELWTQRMHKGGYLKYISATRDDFHKAFAGLINILRIYASEQPQLKVSRREDVENSCRFILDQSRLHRSRGVSLKLFVGAFKTMVQALEDSIFERGFSDTMIKAALPAIRRTVDMVETVVIEDWEYADKPDEFKQLESAYRRLLLEKNTYESIYKRTNNLVLITNHDGYIVEANPEAALFFSRENILGRFCGEVIGISATSIQGVLDVYPPGKVHKITINRDGIPRVYDLWILLRDSQIAKFSGIMLLFNDVTQIVNHSLVLERRVSERVQAQANAEKMRAAIFQSVGEGILLVDQDLEIINANHQAAEMYGIPEQNLIGTDIRSLTDEAGSHQLIGFFDELVEGQRLSDEITGIYIDGRTFPTRTTATRIDYDGKRFWTIIVHDSTEQKAMEESLRKEKKQTEEMNVTLKNVLNAIENDRRDSENRLSARIKNSILPALKKVEKETDALMRMNYLTILGQQLIALTSGFNTELDAGLLKLSKTELEICRLIQAGCSSKEICEALNLSFETIQTHRKNIRKKLNLRGRKVNLHAFLSSRIIDNARNTDNKDEKQ